MRRYTTGRGPSAISLSPFAKRCFARALALARAHGGGSWRAEYAAQREGQSDAFDGMTMSQAVDSPEVQAQFSVKPESADRLNTDVTAGVKLASTLPLPLPPSPRNSIFVPLR